MSPSPGRRFRAALAANTPLVLPGVHDALSARIVERCGFSVGYVSGSAVAMALLGMPDIGILSGAEMLEQTRRITAASDLALVCDADTGFGNAVNVAYTIRALERAGAAGVQLEDQTFPKRCGHFSGKGIVAQDEMLEKLYAAVEARHDDDFVIVARTDARAVAGLEAAIERGLAYRDAGADVIFVEAPQTVDELREVAASIDAPTLVNVVEGGKTPQLPLTDYAALGFAIVLYPTAPIRTTAAALSALYSHLLAEGTTEGAPVPMVSFAERNEITGLAGYEEIAAHAAEAASSTRSGRYQPAGTD